MTDLHHQILSTAAGYPIVLFLAIAILPALGIPNCPLMIGGGAIVASACGMPTALAMAVGGVIANILWTYWVAAFPMREFLLKKIGNASRFIDIEKKSVLMITLLLHVTPGVPLFIQNYFPGIYRLPYLQYLAIAVPIQSLYTTLIVYTSGMIALKMNPIWTISIIAVLAAILWARSTAATRTTH